MSKDNLDADTTKAVGEAQALEAMFASSGWKVAERKLNELLNEFKDISRIDLDNDDLRQQIRDRINLVATIETWLADMKGDVANAVRMSDDNTTNKLMTRR